MVSVRVAIVLLAAAGLAQGQGRQRQRPQGLQGLQGRQQGQVQEQQPEGSGCFNVAAKSPGLCKRQADCRPTGQDPAVTRQICSLSGGQPIVCCPTSLESIVFPSPFLTASLANRPRPPPLDAVTAPLRPTKPRPPPAADGTPGSMARRKCVEYERFIPSIRYGPDKDCVPNHTYPIGGNPALPKEFPHMALLGYGPRDSITYGCGGSLISMVWVLTAAHCVFSGADPVNWALMGELVVSRTDDDAYPQLIPVAERVSHPGFNPPQAYNDIALLRLQWSPNMTTAHVRPTCLHVARDLDKEKLYLTGWGHTEDGGEPADALMEVALYRTKYDECKKYYGANAQSFMPRGVDDDTQLCAGAGQLLKDACHGDSGGPLQTPVIKATCMHLLAGVVSLGQGCGLGAAGIYTRVSFYVPWIEGIVWPDP